MATKNESEIATAILEKCETWSYRQTHMPTGTARGLSKTVIVHPGGALGLLQDIAEALRNVKTQVVADWLAKTDESHWVAMQNKRWIDEVAEVANKAFKLDGCCHWETVCAKIEEVVRRRSLLDAENMQLKRDVELVEHRLRESRRMQTTHRQAAEKEYWAWQGDGEDHLESLTCPVLIPAAELRKIVSDMERYKKCYDESSEAASEPLQQLANDEVMSAAPIRGLTKSIVLDDIERLIKDRDDLKAAIVDHHSQKADDRCIEDDDRLYAAAGLPPCDRRVGSKEEMLANCKRFIEKRCEGGGWPTYAQLEKRLAAAVEALRHVRNFGSGGATDDGISVSYYVENVLNSEREQQEKQNATAK